MNESKSRILELYKNEKGKFIIGGLFLFSFIIQLIFTNFYLRKSFVSALFCFLASWILAFGYVQFRRKYYHDTKLIKYWVRWYIAIIIFSVISLLI